MHTHGYMQICSMSINFFASKYIHSTHSVQRTNANSYTFGVPLSADTKDALKSYKEIVSGNVHSCMHVCMYACM